MQGLGLIYLDRYFDKLSREIWITQFGSADIFELKFEFKLWIKAKLKRKRLFELVGRAGKLTAPAQSTQRSAQRAD